MTGKKGSVVALAPDINSIIVITEDGHFTVWSMRDFVLGFKEQPKTADTRETKSEIEQIELADCMG